TLDELTCLIPLALHITTLFSLVSFTAADTSTFYTLSLHDALPIFFWMTPITSKFIPFSRMELPTAGRPGNVFLTSSQPTTATRRDRKSTRLNSSHVAISYAVFCLKKKKKR